MDLSFIFKKNNINNELYISLDIGTEFVKVIAFNVKEEKIVVKGIGKIHQPLNAMRSGMITNVSRVVSTTKAAIEKSMENIKGFSANNILMGLAGELVRGVLVSASFNRPHPDKKIDLKELNNIINEIKEDAHNKAQEIFNDLTSNKNLQIRLVNTSIVESYIDNYRIDNPIGFSGENLKIISYFTYAPLAYIGTLSNVAKQLKLNPIVISAEPFAVARGVKGGRDKGFGAIIIDIGGGTTDIAVVHNGGFIDTHMLSFGGRVFTKRIASEMNLDYEKAEKIKIDYCKGNLDRPIANIVKKGIMKDIKVWVLGIELALKEFKDVNVFPEKILLCGGGSLLPEIRDILMEHPWKNVLPFERIPQIKFIEPSDVDSIDFSSLEVNGIDMVTPLSIARLIVDLKNNLEIAN